VGVLLELKCGTDIRCLRAVLMSSGSAAQRGVQIAACPDRSVKHDQIPRDRESEKVSNGAATRRLSPQVRKDCRRGIGKRLKELPLLAFNLHSRTPSRWRLGSERWPANSVKTPGFGVKPLHLGGKAFEARARATFAAEVASMGGRDAWTCLSLPSAREATLAEPCPARLLPPMGLGEPLPFDGAPTS